MREQLIAQHKQLTKQLFRTPAKACTDKRLKYVRYADDFLIAVNGTREECEAIKAKLTDFVRDTLKMELSQEKTLITHSNTPARFLGFDVRVRRDASVKRSGKRKMRTIGVCPNCGKPVVEREKGWFCENRECRFVLWKDNAFFKRLGKRLDAHVADKLLRDGRVRLKDCKSAKGKTYNATVLLSCEADGRSKFSLEFEGGC